MRLNHPVPTPSLASRLQTLAALGFLGALLCGLPPQAHALVVAGHAAELRVWLTEQILPYWYDTTLDVVRGGYVLSDDGSHLGGAREKQLVSQTRMLWGFSHAHLRGLSSPQRDYLKAAQHGYRFLIEHFLDPVHGGFYWKTELDGKAADTRKLAYGQAFAIYGLVEYHRASKDPEPLRIAVDLFHTFNGQAHDRRRHGWVEHFRRDWRPIIDPEQNVEVEIAGLKSANTHLHLMEAFAELWSESGDGEVRNALVEALELNKKYFYPLDPSQSALHFTPDWTRATGPRSNGLSYGHNVEFAWLMLRAEETLRYPPSMPHFYAHLHHALRYGYDAKHGGFYNRGVRNEPASQTDKVWWVQAEGLVALTIAMKARHESRYDRALERLLELVETKMADPRDGVWRDTLDADGNVKNAAKAHSWKAAYHDIRALFRFTDPFTPKTAR